MKVELTEKTVCAGREVELIKITEDDKIYQFLMGLDDDVYGTIRSQILAFDSLPSLDKIFNMIQKKKPTRKCEQSRQQG